MIFFYICTCVLPKILLIILPLYIYKYSLDKPEQLIA